MRSFIATKKAVLGALAGYQKPKQDLLMRLMAASEAEGKNGLSDQELFGNGDERTRPGSYAWRCYRFPKTSKTKLSSTLWTCSAQIATRP